MTTLAPWDVPAYQRIVSAAHQGSNLAIQFEDGSWATVEATRVLPPDSAEADWTAMTHDAFEIMVPTGSGEAQISWLTIRALTDRVFATHLATAADAQARHVGLRLRELRQRRDLTSKEVAQRAGITPQSLSRIEHGKHDVVFTTLQRTLAAMGCSLKDLAASPSDSMSVVVNVQGPGHG